MIVPGRGNPEARGVILGEAPGAEEERTGRPFVGRSGQLLSEALAAAGLDEERDVWITNVIKERPENNRTPTDDEVDAVRERVLLEILGVNPVAVLSVGNVPLYALKSEHGITRQRGNVFNVVTYEPDMNVAVHPTFHPAYVLRNPAAKPVFMEDVAEFARAIRVEREEVPMSASGNAFWDEYKEVGGNFVKAEEKEVLIQNGIPFQIVDVISDDQNKYGPRYIVNVLLPNPETGTEEQRSIGFPKGTVDSRDRMLGQMAGYLERDDAVPVMVKIERVNRSLILRKAD